MAAPQQSRHRARSEPTGLSALDSPPPPDGGGTAARVFSALREKEIL